MTKEDIYDAFMAKPYFLKSNNIAIASQLKTNVDDVIAVRKAILSNKRTFGTTYHPKDVAFKPAQKRVLIIGDTHIPYEMDGYLEFCKKQYDDYECNEVIHIGDLIDSHVTSRHPALADAASAGDELDLAIDRLKKWYEVFPRVKVCTGNHDTRVYKIASDSKIASKWIRNYNEVLGVPGWEFADSFEIDGTVYVHGTGTSGMTAAYTRAINLSRNVVIGHVHTESSIIHHKTADKIVFGMIVGCGVNEKSYGMSYAKNFPKKSITSCGIVLGDQPILKIMK